MDPKTERKKKRVLDFGDHKNNFHIKIIMTLFYIGHNFQILTLHVH